MATATSSQTRGTSVRVHVQRFGPFLSSMIMPQIATMVGPTITYLLPILIAYTGGKIVYDVRGGVVGAASVMGVILATSDPLFIGDNSGSPMFLGAMIMGPLTALVMKRLDLIWEGKIKPGFEMLVDN